MASLSRHLTHEFRNTSSTILRPPRSKLAQPGRSHHHPLQLVLLLSALDPGFLRAQDEPLPRNSHLPCRAALFSPGTDPDGHWRTAPAAAECPDRRGRTAHPLYDRRLETARPETASGLRPGRYGFPAP